MVTEAERNQLKIKAEIYILRNLKPEYSMTDLAMLTGRTSPAILHSVPVLLRLTAAGINLEYYTKHKFSQQELIQATMAVGPSKPKKQLLVENQLPEEPDDKSTIETTKPMPLGILTIDQRFALTAALYFHVRNTSNGFDNQAAISCRLYQIIVSTARGRSRNEFNPDFYDALVSRTADVISTATSNDDEGFIIDLLRKLTPKEVPPQKVLGRLLHEYHIALRQTAAHHLSFVK